MIEDSPTDSRTFVTAFARGLRVIESFDAERPRMTLGEVAARTGLDRAVVRRLLLTLVSLGYARMEGRSFELTSQILSLGYAFLYSHGLGGLLSRHLDRLSRQIAETVSVAVLVGTKVIIISRSNAAGRHFVVDNSVTRRLPLHASASGRVMLSALTDEEIVARLSETKIERFTEWTIVDPADVLTSIARCRTDGHVISNQELEEGVVAASVPIVDHSGVIIAALNASSQTSRMTAKKLEAVIVPQLKKAASEMAALMP